MSIANYVYSEILGYNVDPSVRGELEAEALARRRGEKLAPHYTHRIVAHQSGGDWVGIYEVQSGQLVWEGHPSDQEPLEFLAMCDRLDINPNSIDRTEYTTEVTHPDKPHRMIDMLNVKWMEPVE